MVRANLQQLVLEQQGLLHPEAGGGPEALARRLAALALCAFLILTPVDARAMVLTFIAGAGLGYFLELWGTTRACWTYYTAETPPLFAVLAHGMAAVAFWRTGQVLALMVMAGTMNARKKTVRIPRII